MTIQIDTSKEPLYSLEKLYSITSGDQKAIRYFNEVFVQETLNNDLAVLKDSIDKGDFVEVNRIAHKMKSSLDLYCIDSISVEIREIENLSSLVEEVGKIPLILSNIEPTLTKVKEQITALL
ncbi:MAG: HPt (histidine-containing phosphotransfer) domain-containing protein [Flavobacteriales bacterium]|jgi:HPt (histidine-containing phosphotransfer) domain-containing protein